MENFISEFYKNYKPEETLSNPFTIAEAIGYLKCMKNVTNNTIYDELITMYYSKLNVYLGY